MDSRPHTRTHDASPFVVVLTGGVASGKTAVSDQLADLDVPIIDTDVIAREVVKPGHPGLARIVETFGRDVLDGNGALDRRKLRREIFSDEKKRRRLEGILHPLIEARTREEITAAAGHPYVVVVVPLLVETGLFDDADAVVVVDVPEKVQIERLMARDGMTAEQARAMLEAQAGREERLAAADFVIDNSGSPDLRRSEVERLHRLLTDRAATQSKEKG